MSTSEKNPLLFVAVDASTTSIKTLIFDSSGNAIARGRGKLSYQRVERDGYEQDAESWWDALCLSVREAIAELPQERLGDLVGMCIAHQRETIVATDAHGSPLSQALLWMDSRCRAEVASAERTVGSVRLHAVSGKPACTTPSMYKLMYLFRENEGLRERAFIHDMHSFLSLRLTGRAISSFASADPTGLVDMRKKAWSRSLTQLVGIKAQRLPELVEVGYLIGGLTKAAAKATGLPESVLLYAGGGDGQLAGLGAGVTERGRAFIDMGTAISCGTLFHRYEIDSAFRTLHSAIPGKYCLETSLRGGMLTLWWVIEGLLGYPNRDEKMKELEAAAATVAPTSEGLVTLPYFAGAMNPYWDDGASGAFIGLHPSHRPQHLYRSVLEGVALEQRLHLEGVKQVVGASKEEVMVLGGGSRSDLWCQIFSDVLGRPIRRCKSSAAPALGAAILASVAHGVHPSFERASEEMARLGTLFVPGPNSELYEQLYRDVYRGLYLDLRERTAALSLLRQSASPNAGISLFPPMSREN